MAKEFLDYYSSNLSFLRKSSAEFASEFPKIASRLDISGLECLDPFVERLLEGTAFLSARVEKKLDDGYYLTTAVVDDYRGDVYYSQVVGNTVSGGKVSERKTDTNFIYLNFL